MTGRNIVVVLLVFGLLMGGVPCGAFAWSEQGHHLIAEMAFLLLGVEEQQQLLSILKSHPRFDEDFVPPASAATDRAKQLWWIGRAGYWPDVARRQPRYHRSKWHYQLASTVVLGNGVEVPRNPGPRPRESNWESPDLHIAQAIDLCRSEMGDLRIPAERRALALCWLAHLIGDAHQPCHAGSLYAAGLFPDGDRGANSISIKQGRNLHSLWDGLLGARIDVSDLNRRRVLIMSSDELKKLGQAAVVPDDGLDPERWLRESRELSLQFVYTEDILAPVRATMQAGGNRLPVIDLPAGYLTNAGTVARQQSARAAARLAGIWREALRACPAP